MAFGVTTFYQNFSVRRLRYPESAMLLIIVQAKRSINAGKPAPIPQSHRPGQKKRTSALQFRPYQGPTYFRRNFANANAP